MSNKVLSNQSTIVGAVIVMILLTGCSFVFDISWIFKAIIIAVASAIAFVGSFIGKKDQRGFWSAILMLVLLTIVCCIHIFTPPPIEAAGALNNTQYMGFTALATTITTIVLLFQRKGEKLLSKNIAASG